MWYYLNFLFCYSYPQTEIQNHSASLVSLFNTHNCNQLAMNKAVSHKPWSFQPAHKVQDGFFHLSWCKQALSKPPQQWCQRT